MKAGLFRHRWLLARRACQAGILALFAAGPWAGLWLVKGNLAFSLTLGWLPLTDPLVLAQGLAAGHWPIRAALAGAAIVVAFYGLVGGRGYCAWVCPVNPLADFAVWARRRLGVTDRVSRLPRSTRLGILVLALAVSAATGTIAWEWVNPVTLLQRGLVFALPGSILGGVAVMLFDLGAGPHAWCGHLCPVGAAYGLVGRFSLLRFAATRRAACDNCGDCYRVCPEPHVLAGPLRGAAHGVGPVIRGADCTLCGACAEICPKDVFGLGVPRLSSTQPSKGECPP